MKIKSLNFVGHNILGNLSLDFTVDGKCFDNIVLIGENGVGKSTILEAINNLSSYNDESIVRKIIISKDEIVSQKLKINQYNSGNKKHYTYENEIGQSLGNVTKENGFIYYPCILISPDVNRQSNMLNNNKPKIDDEQTANMNLELILTEFVNQDNADCVNSLRLDYSKAKECDSQLRIKRFEDAFNIFFKNIKISKEEDKLIIKRGGRKLNINKLSSGEKQIIEKTTKIIVQKNILNNKLILIDEPEVSLHPKWEENILDFYRKLVSDNNVQKCQLIVATQSEYVLKNALINKNNTLILMLKRNDDETIKCEKFPWRTILPRPTYSEIKYTLFTIYTMDFFNELYGFCEANLEDYNVSIQKKYTLEDLFKNLLANNNKFRLLNWVKLDNKTKTTTTQKDKSLMYYVRNSIHHPENSENKNYSDEDLRDSIECLINVVEEIKKELKI